MATKKPPIPYHSKTLVEEVTASRMSLKNGIWGNIRKLRDHGEPSRTSQSQYDLELNCLLEAWRILSQPEDIKREKEDLAAERWIRTHKVKTSLEENLGWQK